MNQALLSALRKELENSFGRKIMSSRDCLQLVDDIYQKTGYTINSNTLRRFFGLVKTSYSASPSTVTILSKYCGFGSIDEIEKLSVTKESVTTINREEVLQYLLSLFKHLNGEKVHNTVVETMVQQTIVFLERNPSLIDRFQRDIAKIPAGRYYYYELSVNMDRLNDYYGDGLRHYLRIDNSNEARTFVHCLLIFRYWLTEDKELLEKHLAELAAIPVNHNYPSHILGRLIAARLYAANARNESMDKILVDATKYHVAIMTSRGNASPSFPDFELAVCEALILTNNHEEAMEYIRRGKSFFAGFKGISPTHPFRFWENLIQSKKNHGLVPTDLTRKPGSVQPLNYPQNKHYHALLLLLQNPSAKPTQLAPHMEKTGFTRFYRLLYPESGKFIK
jgi:hypothetical protein